MDNQDELRETLHERVQSLRESFDAAVRTSETGDIEASLRAVKEIVPSVKEMIGTLAAHYEQGLDARTASFNEAEKRLAALTGKNKKDVDQDALIEVMVGLGKTIQLLDREVRFLYHRPVLLPFLKAHIKKIMIAAGALVLLIVSISAANRFRLRKYGLSGKYYAGMNFERLLKTRLDHRIDFKWERGSPMWGVPRDRFSIHWDGFLRVPRAGKYEIILGADDGGRLWIDDQKIIDNWKTQKYAQARGIVDLTAGAHKIQVDYFENGNLARVDLLWRYETDPRPSIISMENLVPSEKYLNAD